MVRVIDFKLGLKRRERIKVGNIGGVLDRYLVLFVFVFRGGFSFLLTVRFRSDIILG